MRGDKLGFLTLVLIFAAVLVPVLPAGTASAQCSWMNGLSVVRLLDNANDYRWEGTWDPRFDADWLAHYGSAGIEQCSARDHDPPAVSDPDPGGSAVHDPPAVSDPDPGPPAVNGAINADTCPSAHDIDCCAPCPSISGYYCSLYSCGWVRNYGCAGCSLR